MEKGLFKRQPHTSGDGLAVKIVKDDRDEMPDVSGVCRQLGKCAFELHPGEQQGH